MVAPTLCRACPNYALDYHEAHLILLTGNEKLRTSKELESIPVLQDRDKALGSHVDRERPQTIEMLLKANPRPLKDPRQHADEGVYVGEGLPPFPRSWLNRSGRVSLRKWRNYCQNCGLPPTKRARGSQKETGSNGHIFTLIQCFALYTNVHSQHNPELMAYMVSIVQVSRVYSGLEWVQHDALFWKHTALKADTRWSVINTTLYTGCFTGVLRKVVRCELCWATSHDIKE